MDLGLTGRVVVVTAASKGLGRATAQALAAEGARVVLNARNVAALDELAGTLPDADVLPGDITDPALPGRLVDAAVERWGRLDIVVGNAGGPPTGRALDVTDEQLLAAVNANLLASVRLARAAGVTGRTGDPADFGQVVAFLCPEQARFINGTALSVDGGAVTGLL